MHDHRFPSSSDAPHAVGTTHLTSAAALATSTAVPRERQRQALLSILDRVEELARRTARAGLRPVVEIDLDLCALMPIHRTRRALIEVGRHHGILEALDPDSLTLLPGYSDEAWRGFVTGLELDRRFPQLDWFSRQMKAPAVAEQAGETLFAMFHRLYWTTAWLAEDRPTPGLGAFVHAVERRGGVVVFLSGRWLPEHRGPSLTALRRAGLPRPRLVIGNPWHESTAPPGGQGLSDAQIKAHRQRDIFHRYGLPVAVIDDRPGNRAAVVEAVRSLTNGAPEPLPVAIAIPGFTCDPTATTAPLAISTFETFDAVLGDPPSRRYLNRRYTASGGRAAWGLYEGLGGNGLAYVVPRRTEQVENGSELAPGAGPGAHLEASPEAHPRASLATLRSGPLGHLPHPFAEILAQHEPGSLDELDFIERCASTIPRTERAAIEHCIAEARRLAALGHAAPFPRDPAARRMLRAALIASWLHSRDVQSLMAALGFALPAEGRHDLREYVDATEVRALVLGDVRRTVAQPQWLRRWAAVLEPGPVNVGLLNPALLVGMWRWRPRAPRTRRGEGAMDVHRLSSHHEGDGGERYDPIEAAVNNVLHQREGRLGIRHEPVVPWSAIADAVRLESGAEALAKSSVGRDVAREAILLGERLEGDGVLTPWGLVGGGR